MVSEGQKFIKMRDTFRREDNPPSGTVGYLLSCAWVKVYKKYVHYDDLRHNIKPTPQENAAPGPI